MISRHLVSVSGQTFPPISLWTFHVYPEKEASQSLPSSFSSMYKAIRFYLDTWKIFSFRDFMSNFRENGQIYELSTILTHRTWFLSLWSGDFVYVNTFTTYSNLASPLFWFLLNISESKTISQNILKYPGQLL